MTIFHILEVVILAVTCCAIGYSVNFSEECRVRLWREHQNALTLIRQLAAELATIQILISSPTLFRIILVLKKPYFSNFPTLSGPEQYREISIGAGEICWLQEISSCWIHMAFSGLCPQCVCPYVTPLVRSWTRDRRVLSETSGVQGIELNTELKIRTFFEATPV
jgi:hypothetical protein